MGREIPRTDSLGSWIAGMQADVFNATTSPAAGNQSIVDGATTVIGPNGKAQTRTGQFTWPTAPWAGVEIYGMVTFDALGNPVVVVGLQPDGKYGFGVYDANGVRAVYLGDQGAGLYGLGVRNNATGTIQQVGGAITSLGADVIGYSSGSLTATTASVTAKLGPSGQALVTASLQINASSAASSYGTCQLKIGGSNYGAPLIQNKATIGTLSSTYLVTPGTGNRTFTLYVGPASGSDPIDYQFINLIVQPL